jgi:hypothetical protein
MAQGVENIGARKVARWMRLSSLGATVLWSGLCIAMGVRVAFENHASPTLGQLADPVGRAVLIAVAVAAVCGGIAYAVLRIARKSAVLWHIVYLAAMLVPMGLFTVVHVAMPTAREQAAQRLRSEIKAVRQKELAAAEDVAASVVGSEDRARSRAALVELADRTPEEERLWLKGAIAFGELLEPALQRLNDADQPLRLRPTNAIMCKGDAEELRTQQKLVREAIASLEELIDVTRRSATEWPSQVDPPLTPEEVAVIQPLIERGVEAGMALRTVQVEVSRRVNAVLTHLIEHDGLWKFDEESGVFSSEFDEIANDAQRLWDKAVEAHCREVELRRAALEMGP